MSETPLTSIIAACALLPLLVASYKQREKPDAILAASVALAVAGPFYILAGRVSGGGWQVDLSGALWATVAGTLLIYGGVAYLSRAGWRLGVLVAPYMMLFAIAAAGFGLRDAAAGDFLVEGPTGWLAVHASLSVITYAIATIGAMAATAGFLQQRALKHKSPSRFSRRLPSLADCDTLQHRMLFACAALLGLGLISGSATALARSGALYDLDHKTIFGVLAFALIVALLVADRWGGIRARQSSRAVLAAYLLLTLAYLGVKFVTDVLL